MATNTAASFTNLTGNGTAGPFNISFSYIEQSEVDVTVDGVLKTLGTHYTFTSTSQITFTTGNEPANGAAIKFNRDTDISAKKVDFEDGSVLTENDLDTQNNQLLFGLQEMIDGVQSLSNTVSNVQLSAPSSLSVNIGSTTDNTGNNTGNVTGAVNRPLDEKITDIVNVFDFGAKGDGVTDDSLSLQDAINFCITNGGKELQLNAGVYVLTKDLIAVLDEKFEQLHIKGNGNVIFKCIPTTATSTIGIANKNTGTISTGAGTDFLGVVGDVSINATNPSPSGNSGGFNTGQNYIHFAYDNQIHGATADTGERSVAFTPIDASNFNNNGRIVKIKIDAIVGTDNNGGEYPDISSPATNAEYLELRYSLNAHSVGIASATWNLIDQIIPIQPNNARPAGINEYSLNIPVEAQQPNVSFQLHQPSNTTVDNYGITNIKYETCSASNFLDVTISTNQYASNLNAPRFSIRNIEFAYANETTSVLANGINLKGNNIQGIPTQTYVIESCQFVPWTNTANSTLFDTFFANAVKINNLGEISFRNCVFYGEHDQLNIGTDGQQLGNGVNIGTTNNLLVGSYYFDSCNFTYGFYGLVINPLANTIFLNNCLFQQNRTGIYFTSQDDNNTNLLTGGLKITNSAFTNFISQIEPATPSNSVTSNFCIHTNHVKEIQISNTFFFSGKDLTSNPAGLRHRGCLYLQDSGSINIYGNIFRSNGTGSGGANIYNYTNYKNTAIFIENPNITTTDGDGQIQNNNFFDFASSYAAIYLASTSQEIQSYEQLNVFHNCGTNINNQGTNNITSLPSGGSGATDLINDTTPQLGGNLDVQSSEINTSTTNGNIILNPNGTGVVEVKGDGTSSGTVGTVQLNCSNNNHGVKIASPPHSASANYTLTLPNAINANAFLNTDSNGNLAFPTYPKVVPGTNSGDQILFSNISCVQDSNGVSPVIDGSNTHPLTFRTNQKGSSGSGVASIVDNTGLQMGRMNQYVKLAAPIDQTGQTSYTFTFPPISGSNNQVLMTDGSGTTSWVDQSGGGGLVGSNNEELFVEAENQMDNDFSTTTNKNYISASPLAVASGVTLTIVSGSTMAFV